MAAVKLSKGPADGEASTEPTREMMRSRRKRAVRARSISMTRMTKRELAVGRALYPPGEFDPADRPRTRGDCKDGPRPCPFVSCAHHLYLDVSAESGAIKLNFPDLDADELEAMPESCSLDVADRGGETLEAVGAIMNLTRERIRQVEVTAFAKIAAKNDLRILRDLVGDGVPASKRRLPVLEDDERQEDEDEAETDDDADGTADFDPVEFASDELDSE